MISKGYSAGVIAYKQMLFSFIIVVVDVIVIIIIMKTMSFLN